MTQVRWRDLDDDLKARLRKVKLLNG